MIKKLLGLLWSLLMLPIRLIMLPFKIVSLVLSLIFYAALLLAVGGVVWFVFL